MALPGCSQRVRRVIFAAEIVAACLLIGPLFSSGRLTARDSASTADAKSQITRVFEIQRQAWNAGKVDDFMEHYWKSDNLTFSSGGRVIRGWKATLQRYRDRYPTQKEMGTLEFSDLEVTLLGDSAALVLGNWKLEREAKPVDGNFSVILRKIDDRWQIVHDHTSQRVE